jgi:hypothetical protein
LTTTHRNSPAHSAKGTPSPQPEGYGAPTACRQQVSGSLSLPSRGAFHLSLTVLVHYRWQRVFSLRRWSSWNSRKVSRVPRYLGSGTGANALSPTGLSPSLAGLSSPLRVTRWFLTPRRDHRPDRSLPRPRNGNAGELFHHHGLGWPPFARRY